MSLEEYLLQSLRHSSIRLFVSLIVGLICISCTAFVLFTDHNVTSAAFWCLSLISLILLVLLIALWRNHIKMKRLVDSYFSGKEKLKERQEAEEDTPFSGLIKNAGL